MFTTFLVQPIYNAFILLVGVMPGGDVGFAIIALTLAVRFVFYPLFTSSLRTQMALQFIQPQLNEINTQYKTDPLTRSKKTAELFVLHKVRPLSMIFSTILQVIIFIALSVVFFRLSLPVIHTELLYSFVHAPARVNEHFLGILDLTTTRSVILTALVVASQFVAMKLTLARTAAAAGTKTPEQLQMQRMQHAMMLYFLPAMMAFVAFTFPAAVAIYIITTSLVSIAQEVYIKHKPL